MLVETPGAVQMPDFQTAEIVESTATPTSTEIVWNEAGSDQILFEKYFLLFSFRIGSD